MTEPIMPTLEGALGEVTDLLTAGDFALAVARCDELLSAYPDAVRIVRARAAALEQSGDTEKALEHYTRVLEIAPLDAPAMVGQARCLLASGQSGVAVIAAQQALDIDPTNADALKIAMDAPDTQKNRGRIATARAMFTSGLTPRALSQIRRVIQDNPDRVDAQVALAEMMWRGGGRIATAEHCQSILDAQPDCLPAHVLLSVLWAQMGNDELARLHQREAERFDPDFRETRAWLGDDSPFAVRDIPLEPQPEPTVDDSEPQLISGTEQVVAEDVEEERDRMAFVQELIAASGPISDIVPEITPIKDDLTQELSRASGKPADADSYTGDVTTTAPLEWVPVQSDDEETAQLPEWLANLQTKEVVARPDEDIAGFDYEAPRADGHTVQQAAAYEWSPNSGDDPQPIAPVPAPIKPVAPAQAERKPRGALAAQAVAPEKKSRRDGQSAKARETNEQKLSAARKAIESGRYDDAADRYASLIKSGKKLDAVLADLDVATHAYPDVRRFHALLGDVLARKGDVNAALAAYHRALEIQ